MVEANSIIHVSKTGKYQKEGRTKWDCDIRKCLVIVIVVAAVWVAGYLAFQSSNSSQDKIVE